MSTTIKTINSNNCQLQQISSSTTNVHNNNNIKCQPQLTKKTFSKSLLKERMKSCRTWLETWSTRLSKRTSIKTFSTSNSCDRCKPMTRRSTFTSVATFYSKLLPIVAYIVLIIWWLGRWGMDIMWQNVWKISFMITDVKCMLVSSDRSL